MGKGAALKTVCIIQARRGSTRLRDKIFKPLAGKAVLEHVIERAALIDGVDQVVCATVDDAFNEPVQELAREAGAAAFAGSEHDVLERYYQAAVAFEAEAVMRITADCPLLDPFVCGEAVANVRAGLADYSATAGDWPHGMDCEVFPFSWLEMAHKYTSLPEDREHVTLWMKRHPEIRRMIIDPEDKGLHQGNRWVLDYPADYEFMLQLAACASGGILPLRWQDTLAIIDANPELRDINRQCEADWKAANKKIFELGTDPTQVK